MRKFVLLLAATAAIAVSPPSRAALVAPDLRARLERVEKDGETVDTIVQLRPGLSGSTLTSLGLTGQLKHDYKKLGMVSISLTKEDLKRLAADPRVLVISSDEPVSASGPRAPASSLIQQVSGAEVAKSQFGVTGQGVGIAVLDSGVASHIDLPIAVSANMVSTSSSSSDFYGHGTHVAGLALGSGRGSLEEDLNFSGIASRASLVNVKVLDDKGHGQVSWVLAGINWVLQNRARYKIRVVNLSLGMPARLSYKSDPLCQATKKLRDAGIVTVASAGNFGKSPDGAVAYGSVSTPGNSPWVITVGAVNDKGTAARADDSVAIYSSRGPTRSYDPGTGIFDNLMKPDLVATGNHIVGPEAANNWIVTNYPSFNLQNMEDARYMYLNGTSMAAPVVSGTIALMLQANPSLTPAQVKALLMYTATTVPGFSVYEQGAGEVNAEGAVRMAVALKGAPLTGGPGTVLLAPNRMPTPASNLAGQVVVWSQGNLLIQRSNGTGLVQAGGVLFAEGVVFAEGMICARGIAFSEGTVTSEGVIFAERSVLKARGAIVPGQVPSMTSDYINASGVLFAEATVVGNGSLLSPTGVTSAEGVLFAEGVIFAERNTSSSRFTFIGASALAREPCFSQGVLFAESDLKTLFATSNSVLVAGESFNYY